MRRRGFVLVVVVFFTVLLFSGIATFLRRSTLDAAIVRNRDFTQRAEALARGGVRLGIVLLQQDRLEEEADRIPKAETASDLWALAQQILEITTEDGGTLRIAIEDGRSRINLNALVPKGEQDDDGALEKSRAWLALFFAKIVEEMPGRPEEKPYEPEDLAANLIDYLDEDEVTARGEPEDAWYQEQDPPYRTSAYGALLSVDELALVRGFDAALVDAVRPYVTVFPLKGAAVLNPNTAPTWVLASVAAEELELRLVGEEDVQQLDKVRSENAVCEASAGKCLALDESLGASKKFFPSLEGLRSDVFRIEAQARYGDVRRVVEAVVDRKNPAQPVLLDWRVR
jgi:general secretion pathway protein K